MSSRIAHGPVERRNIQTSPLASASRTEPPPGSASASTSGCRWKRTAKAMPAPPSTRPLEPAPVRRLGDGEAVLAGERAPVVGELEPPHMGQAVGADVAVVLGDEHWSPEPVARRSSGTDFGASIRSSARRPEIRLAVPRRAEE